MLSLLLYKAIDTVFSGVSVPAIIILSAATLIFASFYEHIYYYL